MICDSEIGSGLAYMMMMLCTETNFIVKNALSSVIYHKLILIWKFKILFMVFLSFLFLSIKSSLSSEEKGLRCDGVMV